MNYYFITDFRNVNSFLSAGFIKPNHVSCKTSKYYHIDQTGTWKVSKLYLKDTLPTDLPVEAVLIDLGNILDKKKNSYNIKGNFLNKKDEVTFGMPGKYECYIPITMIEKIYFPNDEMREKYFQMEFKNNFNLNEDIFAVDRDIFNNEISELELVSRNTFDKDSLATIEHNYENLSKNLSVHYSIMNFVFKNNLYSIHFDDRLTKRYKSYTHNHELLSYIHSIKDIADLCDNDNLTPDKVHELASTPIVNIGYLEYILWLSILKCFYQKSFHYNLEELHNDYVDQIKQYEFKKDEIEQIGVEFVSFVEKFGVCKEEDIDYKAIHSILRELFSNYNQLDFTSNAIEQKIIDTKLPLFSELGLFIINLSRYGNDAAKIRNIYDEYPESSEIPKLLISILVSIFIGFEKITRKRKQNDNWKILIDSYCSKNIPIRRNIASSSLFKEKKNWIRESRLHEISQDSKYIIIDNKKYIASYNDISFDDNNDASVAIIPLVDEFGIMFYHRVDLDTKDPIENLVSLEKYYKKYKADIYEQILLDEFNRMGPLEKLKYYLFIKG